MDADVFFYSFPQKQRRATLCSRIVRVARNMFRLDLMTPRRTFLLKRLGVALLCVGFVALLALRPSWAKLPPCLLHETTGLYCPGCGTTRALTRLARADLWGALRYNALLMPALLLALYVFAVDSVERFASSARLRKSIQIVVVLFIVAVVAYTAMRNIPWSAFDWTRPPK